MARRSARPLVITMAQRVAVLAGVSAALAANVASATVFSGNPSNYLGLLDQLGPGDRLELAPGTYTDGLTLTGVAGAAGNPVVITGVAGAAKPVFTPRNCCNTVQLDDGNSYLEIRNLVLDGTGGMGVDAVNSRGITHDIVISGLDIINYNDAQGTVGISTKGSAWNWTISNNRIIGAGTGMYLGNSDGTMPFVAGVIEGNLFIDTIGYNIEIKHQLSRDGIAGMPTGDHRTIIRHNVFSKANNASGGDMARPNLLVGHFPLSGLGSNDLYEIYGNFFYENPSEALFQGEGNIALYDNLFVNDSGAAINVEPHNDQPRTVTIFHNTVVASDNGIRVTGGAAGFTQKTLANAVFAGGTPVSSPNASANITDNYTAASTYLNAPAAAIGQLDLFPRAGKLTGTAVDLAQFAQFTAGQLDFDGRARVATFRGAYSAEGQNDGWVPSLTTPPGAGAEPPPPPPTAPSVMFSANPTTVAAQGSSTLTWSSTNATGCTASGAWSGNKATSGTQSTGALAVSSTFTLTCSDSAGASTSRSVSVTVQGSPPPAPTLSFAADPQTVSSGATSTLTWSSTGATSCTASGGWSGSKSTSGSASTASLTQTTSYMLSCSGPGGSTGTQSVTVTVTATTPGPTPDPPGSGSSGGGSLGWSFAPVLLLALRLRRPGARLRFA